MTDRQIIEFCLKHRISVAQYFILYLTKRRWEGFRTEFVDYTKQVKFDEHDMKDLLDKGMLETSQEDYHTTGINPISLRLTEKFAEDVLLNTDMGEELFNAYPATFPMDGGRVFMARAGMAKDKLIALYLTKIGHDRVKHEFVMKQLAKYEAIVRAGKIHGNKLSDWVEQEMWNNIADIPVGTQNQFTTDV